MHFTLFLSSEKSQRFLKVGWLALEQALVAPPEEDPHRHKKKNTTLYHLSSYTADRTSLQSCSFNKQVRARRNVLWGWARWYRYLIATGWPVRNLRSFYTDALYLYLYWGEPERAPHYRGLREHVHRPTDHVRPIHVILIRCTCTRCQAAMPHSCPNRMPFVTKIPSLQDSM